MILSLPQYIHSCLHKKSVHQTKGAKRRNQVFPLICSSLQRISLQDQSHISIYIFLIIYFIYQNHIVTWELGLCITVLHKLKKPQHVVSSTWFANLWFSSDDYFIFLSYDVKSFNERIKFIDISYCNLVSVPLRTDIMFCLLNNWLFNNYY